MSFDINVLGVRKYNVEYLKNNLTNRTSGNEKIDDFIREMQLKLIIALI